MGILSHGATGFTGRCILVLQTVKPGSPLRFRMARFQLCSCGRREIPGNRRQKTFKKVMPCAADQPLHDLVRRDVDRSCQAPRISARNLILDRARGAPASSKRATPATEHRPRNQPTPSRDPALSRVAAAGIGAKASLHASPGSNPTDSQDSQKGSSQGLCAGLLQELERRFGVPVIHCPAYTCLAARCSREFARRCAEARSARECRRCETPVQRRRMRRRGVPASQVGPWSNPATKRCDDPDPERVGPVMSIHSRSTV